MEKIKVTLISGFLGAGKTTLLNQLLKLNTSKNNFIIENEFGETSIDGSLIEKNYGDLTELNDGCICCTLDTELYGVLYDLIKQEKRPDHLYIEATGVADCSKLASVFVRDMIVDYFELQNIICVIDCETIEDRLKETEEAAKQIVAGDVLVMNKTQFIQEDYYKTLVEIVQKLNPLAKIINYHSELSLEEIKQNNRLQWSEPVLPKKSSCNHKNNEPHNESCGHIHDDDHKHSHDIESILFETDKAFNRQELENLLSVTLLLYSHQIYRIKGLIKIKGSAKQYLVQSTGKRFTIEEFGLWDTNNVSKLVFIGKKLQEATINRILKSALKD
jgi:G3E family GTPase